MKPPVLDLARFARALADRAGAEDAWMCTAVRLQPGERQDLGELCGAHGIRMFDAIDRQLADLAHIRMPASDPAERDEWVAAFVARHGDRAAVGAWIHVPWESRVVHVLGEQDFLDVVTDRNRDKITRDEQSVLRTKRIGVMGLSVGGEAAVTVAQEHLCGAIVLADFDALDLSNLNRLGAGVDDLGVNKARIVARRIAKLDPWLDITIHPDGVTADNVEAFLDGLDMLVEECDDLRMKWHIRGLAAQKGIDIVFAADERGMLSIEPAAEGTRPFHGRIAEAPLPREDYPTKVAFMSALVEWLGGEAALSGRSRAALPRIGTELCGYPQLAGEARLAAAQVAHAARRFLLGERPPAQLINVDLDEVISGPAAASAQGGA